MEELLEKIEKKIKTRNQRKQTKTQSVQNYIQKTYKKTSWIVFNYKLHITKFTRQ